MRVQRFDNLNDLLPYRDAWDRLAGGSVFRGWTWLTAWWRHYGEGHPERKLDVLIAFDDGAESGDAALHKKTVGGVSDADSALLLGEVQPAIRDRGRRPLPQSMANVQSPPDAVRAILPAYVESTWTQGRVLRLLGDGEVCSDHLGLLIASSQEVGVAASMAREIARDPSWELLEFSAIDEDDALTQRLIEELAECDCMISRTPTDRCWTIDLPATWEEFLALQSKSHRKQLRQLERRVLESPRVEWRLVEASNAFGDAWSTLVDLHQRRRQALGEPGCFASPTWAAFHWDVAQQLLAQGSLRLSTLQLDGRPIAAEYHFAGNRTTWAYQGGVDPARLADEPGQLSTIRSLQHAIAEGHAKFDLLRGDEPYKAHWRAIPTQSYLLAAVPNRLWPRLRRGAYSGAKNLRHATRQLTGMFS